MTNIREKFRFRSFWMGLKNWCRYCKGHHVALFYFAIFFNVPTMDPWTRLFLQTAVLEFEQKPITRGTPASSFLALCLILSRHVWGVACRYTENVQKEHREQSSQAGSLLSENPLKSHDLASLKMLIERNSDDIITCPKICKLLHLL